MVALVAAIAGSAVLHFVLHSLEKMQHDRKNSNILGKIKTPGNLVVIRYTGVLTVLQ